VSFFLFCVIASVYLSSGFSSAILLFAEIQQNQQKSAKKILLIFAEQNSKTYAYHDILMKQLSFQRKISRFYEYFFTFLRSF
jgi:hypothetical protein